MQRKYQYVNDDETLDDLLDGDLKIIQKRDGYRFSIDAILLANFIATHKVESVIDLGTGCGIIPILLAHRSKINKIVGVEIQKDMAEMASRSVRLNNLSENIIIIHENINNLKELFKAESFDLVLSNPPYRKVNSGRINPDYQKAIARHEIECSLQDTLTVARYLLKPKGKVCVIFPAVRLGDLMYSLRETMLEPKKLQIVYPNTKSQGKLILVEASKGSGEGLKILEPIFTHDLNGNSNY